MPRFEVDGVIRLTREEEDSIEVVVGTKEFPWTFGYERNAQGGFERRTTIPPMRIIHLPVDELRKLEVERQQRADRAVAQMQSIFA